MVSTKYFGIVAIIIDMLIDMSCIAIACALIVLAFAVPFYLFTKAIIKVEEKEERKRLTRYFWWNMKK